jgi:N-acetylglucosamine-6-phosphate deacetylase
LSTELRGRLLGGPAVVVAIADGKIQSVVEDKHPAEDLPYLAPGLVDIQVNGYGGFDMQNPELKADEVVKLVRRLRQEGVTSFCPTIITHSQEQMVTAAKAIRQACEQYPDEGLSIAGLHLEGPFISSEEGPRGAHPSDHARQPSYDEFKEIQAASGNRVSIVTLAPELPGAIELISKLAADGVVVSLGHCNPTREDIQAAALAGAKLSTHLGNGSHQMIPRHHNYIWEQLAEDRLIASLITDTHHLPEAVVRTMFRAKGLERVIIISDAAFPGGLKPGIYKNTYDVGTIELRPDGYLGVPGTNRLAGSASNLRQCVVGARKMTDMSLTTLWPLASKQPANLLGRSDLGRITPGARADLVLFTEGENDLTVTETLVAGRTVYKRD